MRRFAAPVAAVDEVTLRSTTEVVAVKRIVDSDPYLAGHYPDLTIYPGVFVVESVLQALDALVAGSHGATATVVLRSVDSLRLLAALFPGDTLRVTVTRAEQTDGETPVTAVCTATDGREVARVALRVEVRDA